MSPHSPGHKVEPPQLHTQPAFPGLTSACLSRLISCSSSLNTKPFLFTVSTSPWILECLTSSHTCEPLQRLSLVYAFYLARSCSSLKRQLQSSLLGSLHPSTPILIGMSSLSSVLPQSLQLSMSPSFYIVLSLSAS